MSIAFEFPFGFWCRPKSFIIYAIIKTVNGPIDIRVAAHNIVYDADTPFYQFIVVVFFALMPFFLAVFFHFQAAVWVKCSAVSRTNVVVRIESAKHIQTQHIQLTSVWWWCTFPLNMSIHHAHCVYVRLYTVLLLYIIFLHISHNIKTHIEVYIL